MKVAFIARSTLFTVPGGDTIQVEQTARHLLAFGVHVEIKMAADTIDYENYDLLHFFNLTRPADILLHSQKSGKPYVVSTILCDYSAYDQHQRRGLGQVLGLLPANSIEYIKTMARCALGRDKMVSREFLWLGQRKSILKVLDKAAFILPNSESEYRRVVKQYPCTVKYEVVPNGINPLLFKQDKHAVKDEQLVLCVARIEGIKNQLNLIKALNGTRFTLLLIGASAPGQVDYYHRCRDAAGANVHFIQHVPQIDLVTYYQQAKVHVLPSWFETTGLSSIEAAVMGCNIVVSARGDVHEYFGSDAFYCEPGSPQSILTAVEQAAPAPVNTNLQTRILKHYTWQQAALHTFKAYQQTATA